MTAVNQERLLVGKQSPVFNVAITDGDYLLQKQEKIEINRDPFSFPPIRDVFEPLIRYETVRFNPFDGEVFLLSQRNEQNQIVIDGLDLKKESFWLIFSRLDEASSFCKRLYLDQNKSTAVNNTEEIVFSVIDNFPQFLNYNLNEAATVEIIDRIYSKLLAKGKISQGGNYEYIRRALYHYRGIRKWHYSEQEEKSRLGTVVLDVIDDLIKQRESIRPVGSRKDYYYSSALAILLVEQQIEARFFQNLEEEFTASFEQNLQPHYEENLKPLEESLLRILHKYFDFPIFRCASVRQTAEEIRKAIFKINTIIDKYDWYNPNQSIEEIGKLICKNI